jgi:hypothetical protein
VLESVSAATDLDLVSYLRSIPDTQMRRGVRLPTWYLLLVAALGILSGCQSLRNLERFAIHYHVETIESLGIEFRRPPSDSAFRYFFHQVDVASLCAAIGNWTIAQIFGGAEDLDQKVCDGKTLRGVDRAHCRWRLSFHRPGDTGLGSAGRGDQSGLPRHRRRP